ncbi:MAG TPA: SDR family oxidoreductase [Moraxellaceae bacterium]|nr:SDR family oxidoreductase [Moraxellaceae bacterium]
MRDRLRGKVVAITGAGRGIGLATARALAARGAKVGIGDLAADLAVAAAASLPGAFGTALDVRDKASFARFLEETRATLGPIDVLINNAGIMPMGIFESEDDAISNAQIDINLRGVIHGMKLVLPAMKARGQGHIVNVASIAGRVPIPGASVYCATKFAVIGLTESVRQEVRGSGIDVTLVLPSRVSTELSSGTGSGGIPTASPEEVADAVVYALQHRLPEVTAPRYLQPFTRAVQVMPRWLEHNVRKWVRDDRILTDLDRTARAAYERRLASLKTPSTEDKDGVVPSRSHKGSK